MNIKKLLNKENFLGIIRLVEKQRMSLFRSLKRNGIEFSTKTKSELVSQLFESAFYNHFNDKNINIERAGSDSLKPDILFSDTNTPLEIKTTKGEYWIGGSYSKREGDFLLVSWEEVNRKPTYFVTHVKLRKDDWADQGDKFYGTKFTKKDLLKNETKTILMGELSEANGKIKLIKESIINLVKNK
jgi:hypothetical protein